MTSIHAVSDNVHQINFGDVGPGWEQWVMLSSDRHHDNAHCDRALEKKHLDLARERNAVVVDVGDLFCAMQGKYDPRSAKSAILPENLRDDYLDSLVECAADFYEPYADLFAVIGTGNHESSQLNRSGVNLTAGLVKELNLRNANKGIEHRVHAGGYGGWVLFNATIRKGVGRQLKMKYFHGSGGGGPVTRGVIQTNRQAVYLPDADLVVSGHTHDSWIVPITRERITSAGRLKHDTQLHMKTATYKQEYGSGKGGWHIETGKPPKPLGAIFMKLFAEGDELRCQAHMELQ